MFPNPASSEVNVRLYMFSNETARLTIFDHLGRALLVKYAVEGEQSFQVDLPRDEFPAGLYAVQVVAGKEVLTKQLVIAR